MNNRGIEQEGIYHAYNRGTNKMVIFKDNQDYSYFLNKILEYKEIIPVKIYAFCIMPNHFHILIEEPVNHSNSAISNISIYFRRLLISYAKYYCIKYKHSGNVFQGRYKTKRINKDSYFQTIIDYIANNPVRKRYVSKPELWKYSSKNPKYSSMIDSYTHLSTS